MDNKFGVTKEQLLKLATKIIETRNVSAKNTDTIKHTFKYNLWMAAEWSSMFTINYDDRKKGEISDVHWNPFVTIKGNLFNKDVKYRLKEDWNLPKDGPYIKTINVTCHLENEPPIYIQTNATPYNDSSYYQTLHFDHIREYKKYGFEKHLRLVETRTIFNNKTFICYDSIRFELTDKEFEDLYSLLQKIDLEIKEKQNQYNESVEKAKMEAKLANLNLSLKEFNII